jgi:N-sulfoglucosamine sulfohydrolase
METAAAAPAPSGARSVVLVVADDLGTDDAGALGNPAVRTPGLDALARTGVLYRNAFTPTSSCSPSRAALYTGLHGPTSGQIGSAPPEGRFALRPGIETVFTLWKAAGGLTALIGKVHSAPPAAYPFDFELDVDGRDVARLAELARVFVESVEGRPFLLVVACSDPHRRWTDRRYPGAREWDCRPGDVEVPHHLPDLPEIREELARYYRAISRLDRGVALIREALAATGRADDTLLVFASDNGAPFPGAKTNLRDAGVRVPFVLCAPGMTGPGASAALVSFVDVLPTVLAWAGIPGPAAYALPGRSLLPGPDGAPPERRDAVFGTHTFHEVTERYPMRTVRTERFRYVANLEADRAYPQPPDVEHSDSWQAILALDPPRLGDRSVEAYLHRPPEELYDVVADPGETANLAGRPEHAETLARLRARLSAWRGEIGDEEAGDR